MLRKIKEECYKSEEIEKKTNKKIFSSNKDERKK